MTGIYVHIPYCKKKCLYCSFVSTCDLTGMQIYVKALSSEIEKRADGRQIDTIYIGGGTPSTLYDGAIKSIINTIKKCFCVCDDAEITIEANPESVTYNFIEECVMSGINRYSMGLQSANDEELRGIGRLHNVDMFEKAYLKLKEYKVENINVDLMIGLPKQTLDSAISSAEYVISLRPQHVSVYALSVEEGCGLYGKFSPDEDIEAEMYEKVSERLIKQAYDRYEVSNFALNGKISRHNYKYWTNEEYFGFGAAAHSYLGNVRYANPSVIADYINLKAPTKTILTEQDKKEEYIMLRLRTANGIDLNEFEKKFDFRLEKDKEKEINSFIQMNFVKIDNGFLRLTDKGFYVMNQIIVALL